MRNSECGVKGGSKFQKSDNDKKTGAHPLPVSAVRVVVILV
jgi:hypothetical protein